MNTIKMKIAFNKKVILLLMSALLLSPATSFAIKAAAPAAIISASDDGELGLYAASNIAISTGQCKDCKLIPQALWYFKDETIAVPTSNESGFSATLNAQEDVAAWAKGKHIEGTMSPLIWLGSSQVIPQAKILNQDTTLVGQQKLAFSVTPKIATNLSFWDESTDAFFANHEVRLRGETVENNSFAARTVWPLDYKLALNAPLKPLDGLNGETLKTLVQFENGGAKSNYEARLLQGDGKDITGKAVIALMLNGAQGDDDEALGGHFGLATGRVGTDGDMSKWLVNNYYNLGSNSEKGIIAAATPMDKYLMDVNNGQSYYRPSYMLVAALKQDALPNKVQDATNRVLNHFYRNDFLYDHSRDNCAGISIDTLRTLGWNIPERGVTSYLKAIAAYFYIAASERSLSKGRAIYDYLTTETTRLFPAVTFDAIGNNMLNQNRQLWVDHNPQTTFTKQLSNDIEAIYFVRIPQVPSNRKFGSAPVYSFDEYMKTAPADHSQWKMVPTTPRVLPENLKDGLALNQEKVSSIPWPVALLSLSLFWGLIWGFRKLFKFNRK